MNSLWDAVNAVGGWYEGSLSLVASRVSMEAGAKYEYPVSLRELLDHLATPVTYAIDVYTGEVANAGTDADVFITLHGRWGIDLPERKLDNPGKNDFERDSKSSFTVTGPLIGGVNSIRIRHDNTGNAPGWYLDQVAVRRVGALINFFPCYRWLAWDEADCAIDLIVGSFPEPIPTPGVPLKCKPQAEPKPPAPEVQGTVGSYMIYNCVPEHRPIHIWTFDLSAPSVWKEEGKLDDHYDANVCPVGQPLIVEFESDHTYLIYAVDPKLIGCPGNYPETEACIRQKSWVKSKEGGPAMLWILPKIPTGPL